MRAVTFLMTACLDSSHSLERPLRTNRHARDDGAGRNISCARECTYTHARESSQPSSDVNTFQQQQQQPAAASLSYAVREEND